MSASRAAALVGDYDTDPAYVGLADAFSVLIGDGRIPTGTQLPSERELTLVLGCSRTTVTRAYQRLRETGYAWARHGSGTFTQLPGGRGRHQDRALLPGPDDGDAIDLNCAATTAPPGLAAAYAEAVAELPAYLGGHGYFPAGLPALQAAIARRYDARGLPTDPAQILVTHGALTAAAVVAQTLTSPGDRVVVESPVFPNAPRAMRNAGARLRAMPVDPSGWDLREVETALKAGSPRLAYLIPDFQNPTGHLMGDAQREEYAALLRRFRTVAVVDEAFVDLALDGQPLPMPFAAHAPDTLTLGSASKAFWGGMRLGWIRAPIQQVERLTRGRLNLDLGAPVLEQLVLARILEDPSAILHEQRARLARQRDALIAAVASRLPSWRFVRPGGGLCLWCELPEPVAGEVALAADHLGVIVAPGPVFATEGGLGQFLRIPWSRPEAELVAAVDALAGAWERVQAQQPAPGSRPGRVVVA